MVFISLTLLCVISIIYCCDIPVISGWEFMVNQKESMIYGVALSVIASYVFYFIQIWLPKKQREYKANIYLRSRVISYLENFYDIIKIVEDIGIINYQSGRIGLNCKYIEIQRNDWNSVYIQKIDLENYRILLQKQSENIRNNIYFGWLDNKKMECLQILFDNKFLLRWITNIKMDDLKINDMELIEIYNKSKKDIIRAQKRFKINYEIKIVEHQQDEFTDKLDSVLQDIKDRPTKGIVRIKIRDNL